MNTILLKTECVGRLLVDLPAKAGVSWTQTFDWAEVTRMPGIATEDEFWKKVEDRKKELESLPHDTEPNRLGLYRRVNSRSAIILFRSDAIQDETYHMDRYLWLGDRGYYFKTGANSEQIKNQLDQYSQVFSQITPRDGIPDQPGFCIDGALVVSNLDTISAYASQYNVNAKDWKNVSLTASMGEDRQPRPSTAKPPITPYDVLKREQDVIRELGQEYPEEARHDRAYPKDFKVIRKRERTLGGLTGQEVIYRKVLNSGATLYHFDWGSVEQENVLAGIFAGVDMYAGDDDHPEDATPPEDQLIALWDAILESARMRPRAN